MEPCAPGTEDEPPIMYSTLNKQENEQERLLNQKGFLRNGKYENIFELSYQNGAEHWYCRACECPVMGRVFQHEAGKRHTLNIFNANPNLENYRRGPSPDEHVAVEVAPGEPLPPGFEDVGRVSQIQERLDGFKVGPLVALEYLLELQDDDTSKEPVYLCILCDKKGDPRTVLTHLASYNHISQYLQKHFPTCWRALAPYNTKQYRRNWQTTLQKIAEGIEKKFGRLKPYPIDKDKFDKDRMHFLQIVGKGRHFSENTGYTFEELVVHDELTKTHDEDKSYESSANNNWGNTATIQKPFKKRSPSPPIVGIPSKKNKGNAQTNPRKAQNQEPAYVVQAQSQQHQSVHQVHSGRMPSQQSQPNRLLPNQPPIRQQLVKQLPAKPQNRRRSLSSVSSLSDKSDGSDNDRRKYGRDKERIPIQRGKPPFDKERPLPYGRRRSPSPRRRSPFRHRSPSPKRRISPKLRSRSPNVRRRSQSPTYLAEQEKEKIRKVEEFRKLGRAIENDMHKTLKQHEKNPEKHPQYNEEWKKFWNKRYKELKADGVDVQKHDFKPEWIGFWNKRMVEIHSDELRNRKEALRKRLGLPETINPIKFKIGGSLTLPEKISTKPLPMAAQPDQDNEVIVIEDKDDDKVKRVVSPWDDRDKSRGALARKPPTKHSVSPVRRDSPNRYKEHSRSRSRERVKVRDRSKSKERSFRRSLSKERIRVRNVSPISPTSRSSRPLKRSSSRERFSGRRSRSKSGDKTSATQSTSGDRIPKMRNTSPNSVNSNVSRSNRGRYRDSRERSLSRNRSHSRSRGLSPYKKKSKERRSLSRERSWEKRDLDRKRQTEYTRESSFERDLRAKERVRTVADLPWERNSVYRNPYLPPPIMRDATRKPVDVTSRPIMPLEDDDDDETEVNVVDVLRLLTALEERLGSLGPKVIDLLAQALAFEKNEANSSESLLDNDINCVLFETVKEKLKGQLFAGLVDILQERAFKKAIKKIASLMHLAAQRKKHREKLLPKVAPVTVPGVGSVDKAAIARQIANALVAQGKTDVSQAELETLINAVVGMAEASRNSNRPMTTANFLQLLGDGNAHQETQDKIIIPSTTRKSETVDLDKLVEPLTPSPGRNTANNMENLSDSDLQTLLQNFKDLSTEEQHNLINYLKKLEYQEPERVERLRKFVNLDPSGKSKEDIKEEDENVEEKEKKTENKMGRESPFSNRLGGVNPACDLVDIESDEENIDKGIKEEKPENEQTDKRVHVDSEDEYSFEDVVKTVSKNVKDKEMEHSKKVLEDTMNYDKCKSDTNLNSAKDLISNLMGNIAKNNFNSINVDLLGLGGKPLPSNPPTSMANVDLAKLGDISMANLGSILKNVKNMITPDIDRKPGSPKNKLNFDLAQLKSQTQEKLDIREPSSSGGFNKGGPLTLNLLDRTGDRSLKGHGFRFESPKRPFDNFRENPEFDKSKLLGADRLGSRDSDRYGSNGSDKFESGGSDRYGSGDVDRYSSGATDRFGPGDPDRFGPGASDRFGTGASDRFGTGGSDRFGPGGPDRYGPDGTDRYGPGGADRFGPGGADRFGPSGTDRFGPSGTDTFGPGTTDRFGPAGSDRFGDRLVGPGGPRGPPGSDRFGGISGPERFGGTDRNFGGPKGPDRGFNNSERLGGHDKGFGALDRNFDPDRGLRSPLDRDRGAPWLSGPGPGAGGTSGPGFGLGALSGSVLERVQFRGSSSSLLDSKGPGNFGNKSVPPFGNDLMPRGGPQRPGPNDQRHFSRLPAPDFNRTGGNFNRW